MLIFVVNIRPEPTFWNSTHCLLSPFTLDWSRNLWHNPMSNMAVNNISYPIYPLSTRTEKGYNTKMIPFFFCSVYILRWICRNNSIWKNVFKLDAPFVIRWYLRSFKWLGYYFTSLVFVVLRGPLQMKCIHVLPVIEITRAILNCR